MWPTAKQVLEDRRGGTGDGKVSVLTFGSVFGSGDFRETLKVSGGRHARATLSPTEPPLGAQLAQLRRPLGDNDGAAGGPTD